MGSLEFVQEDGTLRVIRRRGWGWGVVFTILACGLFLLGAAFGVFGQHLPRMSVLSTTLWALSLGAVCGFLGVTLTRHGESFFFTGQGLQVEFYRWRFVHWAIDYPSSWLHGVLIQRQTDGLPLYRVVVEIKKRPPVEIAFNLRSNEAWELASAIAGPGLLAVHEE